ARTRNVASADSKATLTTIGPTKRAAPRGGGGTGSSVVSGRSAWSAVVMAPLHSRRERSYRQVGTAAGSRLRLPPGGAAFVQQNVAGLRQFRGVFGRVSLFGSVAAAGYPPVRMTWMSRSRIFLRKVLRLTPRRSAARIWLPRVAASAAD